MIAECSHCGFNQEIPHTWCGRKARCPQCQSSVTLVARGEAYALDPEERRRDARKRVSGLGVASGFAFGFMEVKDVSMSGLAVYHDHDSDLDIGDVFHCELSDKRRSVCERIRLKVMNIRGDVFGCAFVEPHPELADVVRRLMEAADLDVFYEGKEEIALESTRGPLLRQYD